MKKIYLITGFIIFLIVLTPALGSYKNIFWERQYDAGFEDISRSVALDSKGNVLVTGLSIDPEKRNRDFFTIKYNNKGDTLWEKRLDVGLRDESYGIATDSKDNVIITGTANGKFYTVKYDSNGDVLWKDSHSSSNGDAFYAVAIDSEDNIIVAGRSKFVVYDYYTIKYDKNGKLLWKTTWTNGEDDVIYDIALDSQDNIIVTGFSSNGVNHKGRGAYTYFTFKYDKNGKELWNQKWGKPHYSESYGVAVDSKDNIIITGFVIRNNSYDFYTLKCDSNGKIIWDQFYSRSNLDRPYAIAVDSLDNILIVGTTLNEGYNHDIILLKYNSKGEFISEDFYDYGTNDIAYGLAIDSEDNIYITGGTRNDTWDYITIKLKSDN